MPRNQVQFQKGMSIPQFLQQYGTEEQCRETLFRWRWPQQYSVSMTCGGPTLASFFSRTQAVLVSGSLNACI